MLFLNTRAYGTQINAFLHCCTDNKLPSLTLLHGVDRLLAGVTIKTTTSPKKSNGSYHIHQPNWPPVLCFLSMTFNPKLKLQNSALYISFSLDDGISVSLRGSATLHEISTNYQDTKQPHITTVSTSNVLRCKYYKKIVPLWGC